MWSTPVEIITDADDYPVAGWMDDDGNVFVAWTQQTTGNLMSVKLSYAAGAWSLNTEATVYSLDDNYFPALYKDRNGTLLITWSPPQRTMSANRKANVGPRTSEFSRPKKAPLTTKLPR